MRKTTSALSEYFPLNFQAACLITARSRQSLKFPSAGCATTRHVLVFMALTGEAPPEVSKWIAMSATDVATNFSLKASTMKATDSAREGGGGGG